jgi:hypothetical protein
MSFFLNMSRYSSMNGNQFLALISNDTAYIYIIHHSMILCYNFYDYRDRILPEYKFDYKFLP